MSSDQGKHLYVFYDTNNASSRTFIRQQCLIAHKENTMKSIKAFRTFILVVAVLFPVAANSSTLGELRLSYIEEDAQLWNDEAGEWIPVSINMPLYAGDRLWVPENGKLEIQARNGTFVRLNEYSSLEIIRIEADSQQLYLSEGRAYFYFRGFKNDMIQLDTPFSSIRAYEGAKFLADVARSGETDISVVEGELLVDSSDGSLRLKEGQRLALGQNYAEISALGRPDYWEKWNRDRDWKIADRQPRDKYLPDELRSYAGEFEEYGRWVRVREHGYVWTPTFSIVAGWSPYSQGRWIWRGGDYVWISYEPWGWVPYHYGRWSFIASVGWCWVPPSRGNAYWGPGYVGWVSTPTYVAWVPLAPGEIYYGYGDYGPYSMNIININISKTIVKHSYKNVQERNAVTIVHHDTFLRGRHRAVNVKENPFLKHRTHLGRPSIAPEKETYAPISKDIPETKLPPEYLRRAKTKHVHEERPLVKEKGSPVLKPDSYEKSRREWKRERGLGDDAEGVRQETYQHREKNEEQRAVAPPDPGEERNGHSTPKQPADQRVRQQDPRFRDRSGPAPRREKRQNVRPDPKADKPVMPETTGDAGRHNGGRNPQEAPAASDMPNQEEKVRMKDDAPGKTLVLPGEHADPSDERSLEIPSPSPAPAPPLPRARQLDGRTRDKDQILREKRDRDWNKRPRQEQAPQPSPVVEQQSAPNLNPERAMPAQRQIPGQAPRPAPQAGPGNQQMGGQDSGKGKKGFKKTDQTDAQENLLQPQENPDQQR